MGLWVAGRTSLSITAMVVRNSLKMTPMWDKILNDYSGEILTEHSDPWDVLDAVIADKQLADRIVRQSKVSNIDARLEDDGRLSEIKYIPNDVFIEEEELALMFEDGMKIENIADQFECSATTVRKFMRLHGIPSPRGHKK